jgi:4-hydroxy-3-methylbut-2-en-1-yl diphosphate reductase
MVWISPDFKLARRRLLQWEGAMRLVLTNPRGFCAGVDRALAIVEELLDRSRETVFVRHEIVHNSVVVGALRARGAVFVETVDEIPPGALAVISAHGAPPDVFEEANKRRLRLIDATCPLVTKVHREVARHAREGRSVIVIGHRDHVEVRGTVGHYRPLGGGEIQVVETVEDARNLVVRTPDHVGYVTQTTLAVDQTRDVVDALKGRYPNLVGPHSQDICYATQNRQNAVRRLAAIADLILVIGAPHSSNSVRMCEVARQAGVEVRLIERPAEIKSEWLAARSVIGLTSSASAPEALVQSAVRHIRALNPDIEIEEMGESETVKFRLPMELRTIGRTKEEGDASFSPSM